jgi:hypothetical protein
MLNDNVIQWLLEDSDPAVKYRTQTEILDISKEKKEVKLTHKALLESDLVKSVMAFFDIGKDYSDSHALSALAEYGLTRMDVDIDPYVDKLITNTNFRDGCDGGFLLRNLVMLGYDKRPVVKKELPLLLATQQGDGGFPCTSKNPKIKKPNVPHKSCFQMTTSYLLLTAEMYKKGIDCPPMEEIVGYFLGRDVLFRHDKPDSIVKKEMGTTFHPPVCTRIGLHMILYALSVLGKGNDRRCKRAWELLHSRRGDDSKYFLDGSLTKPYIKLEKPGKASKWVTFYALLAERYKSK